MAVRSNSAEQVPEYSGGAEHVPVEELAVGMGSGGSPRVEDMIRPGPSSRTTSWMSSWADLVVVAGPGWREFVVLDTDVA